MIKFNKNKQLSLSTHWLLSLFLIVFLAACGGGGGGGGGNGGGSASDKTAPVITLNGESSITLTQGDTYTEEGATAIDDRDGNVNVTISGSVDTGTVGTYIITYTASDSAGNTSSLTRTITITQLPFITTWKTDNFGQSNDNQIKIGTSGGGYDYQVDWGDGSTDSNVTGDITHTYAAAGTYTVSISGTFPRLYFGYVGYDYYKILTIEQWGSQKWLSMNKAFYSCANLTSNAVDAPDLSMVTDMSEMFDRASAFNQDVSNWNVSSITNMHRMFAFALAFNQDISNWDVSSVTDMSAMFAGAETFNQDLSNWDVSSVTDMSGMFAGAETFNQDLSNWDVSSVTDMSGMFSFAKAFNQDLNSWDVSSVTDMSAMFDIAPAFNHDLSNWDVSSVTDMGAMFRAAVTFNQDLSNWNVSSVTFTNEMFSGATAFDQNLGSWNVTEVTYMASMFLNAKLSTANYDALLAGWSVQSLQNDVEFNGGNSTYSASSQAARDTLTNVYNWTVTDGGVEP